MYSDICLLLFLSNVRILVTFRKKVYALCFIHNFLKQNCLQLVGSDRPKKSRSRWSMGTSGLIHKNKYPRQIWYGGSNLSKQLNWNHSIMFSVCVPVYSWFFWELDWDSFIGEWQLGAHFVRTWHPALNFQGEWHTAMSSYLTFQVFQFRIGRRWWQSFDLPHCWNH